MTSRERPVEPKNLHHYTQAQLGQFIDAHERFLTNQARARRAVLRFLQAEGIDLSGRRLGEADFTGANFRNARMMRTDFERADLFCADLSGADAREANFRRADLRGVAFRDAALEGAILDEADLREAVLMVSSAKDGMRMVRGAASEAHSGGPVTYTVDFTNCSMKKSKLRGAKLKGANFAGALLDGADLEGADLTGANFRGAVLIGVKLDRVIMDPDALKDCVTDPGPEAVAKVRELQSRLEGAQAWISSNGKIGAPARLDDEDLRPLGQAFEGRRLTALSAQRACGIGVSFAGAQLQAAKFDGADLRDANFSGADLRGASFKGANLHHARFDNANLRDLPLGPDRTAPVDFSGAKYGTTAFSNAIS